MRIKNTRKVIHYMGRKDFKPLTQEQVLALDNHIDELTEKMKKELTPGYIEIAKCPMCGLEMNKSQRILSYTTDPTNIKTRCFRCRSFYQAYIQLGENRYVLYAKKHIIFRLRDLWSKTPEEICKIHPSFYHSCIYNYGNLTKAFQSAKIKYTFVENEEWKEKVIQFLGKLTDKVIADVVGVEPAIISKMRRANGDIPKFVRSNASLEIQKK